MEGVERDTRPAGREVSVLVFGNTADEIELAALDEGRLFFGEAAQLRVVRDYKAWPVAEAAASLQAKANGKLWHARVIVRTIEPGGGQ